MGPVARYLLDDHRRLEALLARARASPPDQEAYRAFRAGLLRHIGMEEKVLLPEARRLNGGVALPVTRQLRADHAVIAALLVPTPTPQILADLATVLDEHNPLEEGPQGVYAACEVLLGDAASAMVARLEAVPAVKEAPHFDGPRVGEHLARLMAARRGAD